LTNKVVISHEEIAEARPPEGGVSEPTAPNAAPKMPRAIPLWARALFWPLVLVPPLLCLVAVVLRMAFRNQPPRTSDAWARFLCTLLIVSGLIGTVGTVALLSFVPMAPLGAAGLAEFDERAVFPTLPSAEVFDGEGMSRELKPLVVVVSPATRMWFGREVPSNGLGAGALLIADEGGYLFITARHVTPGPEKPDGSHVFISDRSGGIGTGEIVGYHKERDLALLWMPRHSGHSQFFQPLSAAKDGQPIFVIGHPEGLRYSLTNGMISREQPGLLQISAPVSPGNSGGPVYDNRGNLLGIVTGAMDKRINPNAENLNFAVSSNALRDAAQWELTPRGLEYIKKLQGHSAGSLRAEGN
jgi:S1-C subfamily serine protease